MRNNPLSLQLRELVLNKIICFGLFFVLIGCSSTHRVKPNLTLVYDKEKNSAQVVVTQDISSSDKSMERLVKQGSTGIGGYLKCPSGQMKMTWLNNGKPVLDKENPQAKVLTLGVECI